MFLAPAPVQKPRLNFYPRLLIHFSGGDMFAGEPARHPALKVVNMKPFNAEIPLELAADSFYTPNELFYVRNHLGTPNFTSEDEYELEITGIGLPEEGKTLTLSDIKKFPKYEVVSTVQCGGNRRAEMKAVKDLKGLPWTGGAIGNAKWGGARLYDVLKASGILLIFLCSIIPKLANYTRIVPNSE